MTDKEILESIKDKDFITYIAYVDLLVFFMNNSKVMSRYVIGFENTLTLSEEGMTAEENKKADEEKKEADVILKFADKRDKYVSDLKKYRDELSPENVKKAHLEAERRDLGGLDVESHVND